MSVCLRSLRAGFALLVVAVGLVTAVPGGAAEAVPQPRPRPEYALGSAITNVHISPTGHPGVCWQAASASNQAKISLRTCSTSTLQNWNLGTDDNIRLTSNTSLCLDNNSNGTSLNYQLNVTTACGSSATNAVWPYFVATSGSTPIGAIRNTYRGLCANAHGGSFTSGTTIIRYTCSSSSANEKWSIGTADMQISSSADVTGKPGAVVTPALRFENAGPQPAVGTAVSFTGQTGFTMTSLSRSFAAGIGYGSCTVSSATAANCPYSGSPWFTDTGTAAHNGDGTGFVGVTGTIASTAKPGDVYRICATSALQATNDTTAGNNSGCATVTVVPYDSDLSMTTNGAQTSTTTASGPSASVAVPFTMTNTSTTDPAVVPKVTFAAPSGFTVTQVTGPSGWSCSTAALTCTGPGGGLAAAGTAQFTVRGSVPATATAGATYPVTATSSVTGTSQDTNTANDTATNTVQMPSTFFLLMTKGGPASQDPGTPITYTVTARNTASTAIAGVTISDPVPASITNVSWTCAAVCSPATGSTNSVTTTVTLPANGSVTIQVNGTIAQSAAGTTVTNTATMTMPSGVTNTGQSSASVDTVVAANADLAIAQDTTPTVTPGRSGTMPIKVTNNGPAATSGTTTVTISPPDNVTFGPAASLPAGCTLNTDGTVTCTSTGSLAANTSTTPRIPFTVDASAPQDTTLRGGRAKVTNSLDSTPGNNEAALTVRTSSAVSDFTVAVDPIVAVTPGGTGTMTVTATNLGPSTSVSQARVTITMPLLANASRSVPSGCTYVTAKVVECVVPAGLAVNGTGSWVIPFTVSNLAPPDTNLPVGSASVINRDDPVITNNLALFSIPTTGSSADLAITKALGTTTSVAPGQSFDFVLTAVNNGPSVSRSVTVTDTLPTGLTFVSASGGTCSASGQTVTCGPRDVAQVGETLTITLTVRVDPAYTGDGSDLSNTARIASATTRDPKPGNNSSTADPGITVTPASADVALAKDTTTSTAVAPGGTFSYTLQGTNSGPSQATGVTITDTLPANLAFVFSASGCTGTAGQYGGTVTCPTASTLPVGGTPVTHTVTVMLNPSYTGNGGAADASVRNTATAATTSADPVSGDNTDTAGLPGDTVAAASADLSIAKALGEPRTAPPGGELRFTLTVSNAGPSTASGGTVTDTLPAGLTYTSSDGTCTASGQTVTCQVDPVVPGTPALVRILVTVDPAYTGDGSDLTNRARVTATTTDPDDTNNTTSLDLPTGTVTTPSADISLTKAALGAGPVNPGETFDYRFTVTNGGPSTAVNVTVSDTLPSVLAFAASGDCTGTADEVGGTVTCGPVASLAPKATRSFLVKVKLDPGYTGDGSDITNTATADADTDDPDPRNNSGSAGVPPVGGGEADLALTKTVVGTPTVRPGETFRYHLTATNSGPSIADSPQFTDTLPSQLAAVTVPNNCSGPLDTYGATITCVRPDNVVRLTALQTYVWTITVRVDPAYTGNGSDLVNAATLSSDTDDPDDSNNASTATGGVTVRTPQADLATTKTALGTGPVTPGQQFAYRVTVTNNGPSTAVNVTASDPLPSRISFVSSASGCTGTVGQLGGTVSCGPVATLAPQASTSFVVTVQLDPTYTGDGSDLSNTATSGSATTDPDPGNDTSPPVGPPGGVTAPQADLGVTKRVATTMPVRPGGTFDYTITSVNNGPSVAVDATMTDTLPAQLSYVSHTGATCTPDGQRVICGPAAAPVGGQVVITLTVRVDPAYTGDGSDLVNTAAVASGTTDPVSGNDSATVTGGITVLAPRADLATTKSALGTGPVTPGRAFDYRLTVTNNGPSTAVDVVVTDPLPTGLSFVSSVSSCTAVGQDITCPTIDALAPIGSRTFTIRVRVDPGYTGDGSDLGNTATATSGTTDPDTANNTSGPVTPPGGVTAAEADLVMAKSSPATGPIGPGEAFDYVLRVGNDGPSDAADVSITDTLPSILSFVSSADGCTATVDQLGGTVTCPVGAMAVSGTATRTIRVRVDPGYTGDGTGVTNSATVTADTADPTSANNTATAPVPGGVSTPEADLSTAKAAVGTGPVAPGATFDYDVTITNGGPATAVNVTITDNLPAGLALVSSQPDGCTPVGSYGATVTCPAVGTLAVGAPAKVRLTVRITPSYAGDTSTVSNTATAGAGTADPDTTNNTSPAAGPPGGVAAASADLVMAKTVVTASTVTPGGTVEYRLTATNNGPSDAQGVVVTDTLPTTLTLVRSEPSGCTQAGQTVTCPAVNTVTAGSSTDRRLTVRLDAAYTGDGSDLADTGSVTATTADPDTSNNASTVTGGIVVGPPTADVSIAKTTVETDPVTPGGIFRYTLTVANAGPSAATNVVATDLMPPVITLDPSDTSGCTAAGQRVTCPAIATLPAGGSTVFTLTAKLDPSYTGDGTDLVNHAVVTSGTSDPDRTNNEARVGLPAGGAGPPSADVRMTKGLLGSGPVTPGTEYEYTVTLTNDGPSTARDVVVTDPLPAQVAWAAQSTTTCSYRATTHSVVCVLDSPLAVGASFTRTFKVVLDPSYTGGGSDISNTVTAHASTADPDTTNNSATVANVPGGVAAPDADVYMTKRFGGDANGDPSTPIAPGGTLNYVLDANNKGPSTATDVDVSDQLPSQLAFVSSADGCTGTVGAYGGTVTCPRVARLNVDPASVNEGYYRIVVRLDPSYTGTGTDIMNTTSSTAATGDPDSSNNSATAGIPPGVAVPVADVAVAKEPVGSTKVRPGGEFEYALTVSNAGPSTATAITVTDPLPAALSFVSSADGCAAGGQTVTCPTVATLAPGDTKRYLVRVGLSPAYTGNGSDITNTVTVAPGTTDPDRRNNTASAGVPGGSTLPPLSDLAITKQPATATPVAPGQSFDYTVVVSNLGPSAVATWTVTDRLPAALAFVGSTPAGCTVRAGVVTCPATGRLEPTDTATYTLTVRLDPGYAGDGSDIANQATVRSTNDDPDTGNNTASAGVPGGSVAAPKSDLAISIDVPTAPLAPGEAFVATVRVTNLGPSTTRAASPVTVVPPRRVRPGTALPPTCTAGADGRTVTCTVPAGLAPRAESATGVLRAESRTEVSTGFAVPYQVDVGAPERTTLDGGTATVSNPADTNGANDSVPWQVRTGAASADLSVTKRAGAARVTPGATFAYTITAGNTGPSNAVGVTITDTLPPGLAFAGSPDGCAATGQRVSCPVGLLAAGGTVRRLITVTLDTSYTGDTLENRASVTSDTADPEPGNNAAGASVTVTRTDAGGQPVTGAPVVLLAVAGGSAVFAGLVLLVWLHRTRRP